MRKTKIVCTLGPASEQKDILRTLIQAGLNVARFNFSHGDYEEHGKRIVTIGELNKELGTHVAMMLDTKGPEIRTHEFDGKVEIKKGSQVRVAFEPVMGNAERFSVSYPGLYDDIKVGEVITVDDGYLTLEVIDKDAKAHELITKARNTHTVKSRRGVNVPNVVLNMPFVSVKDRADLEFAAKMGYDFIAASFMRRADDAKEIRSILDAAGGKDIQIIAKIENQEGMDNLDEILEVVDAIMVARGDLGIEVPAENVPQYQSEMIEKCLIAGKPVIVATQMLESMQKNPRPTRAEVSDVFNAVKEGTSATMLSGESAAGDYPFEAVSYMAKIDVKAEEVLEYPAFVFDYFEGETNADAVAKLAALHVSDYAVNAIVAHGKEQAISISNYHPQVPVIALVKDEKEAKSLAIRFAVHPVVTKEELANKLVLAGVEKGDYYIEIKNDKLELKQA